jgi:TolB-like protein
VIGYIVLAWLMAQVAELILDTFGAPEWVMKSLLALFLIVLPFVVYFSWAFELTPEGVKRESEVEREQSITRQTGRRLDRAIIVVLVLALAWFAWDRYTMPEQVFRTAESVTEGEAQVEADLSNEPAPPVVAVLPFKATGSDDGGFLAGGLHDDLLTRLAKLDVYRVISRTSVMEYAGTTKNMRQIGQELGAGYILEGGVQALHGRVRINAQLIVAADDQHLWAEVYDHELSAENLFDVQAELATAIANALHTELSPVDQTLVDDIPTRNLEAYNAYLRGLQLSRTSGYIGTPSDHESVAAFEEAVKLDPEFAEAWAHLSRARVKAAIDDGYSEESSGGVLAALARARELKPGMLESVGRYQEAYAHLQQARKLAPRDPSVLLVLTHYAWLNDDCTAAEEYTDTLQELAPDWPPARVKLAEYEIECNGNTSLANEIYKKMDIADIGNWFFAYIAALHVRDAQWALTLVEWDDPMPWPFDEVWDELNTAQVSRYLLGDEDSVAIALNRAETLLQEFKSKPKQEKSSNFALTSAYFHSLKGDAQAAADWLVRYVQRYEVESKGDVAEISSNRLASALVLAQAGLHDEAVEELRTMLEEPGGYRFPVVDGLPIFEVLETHPEYAALRKRFGHSRRESITSQR